MQKRCMLLPEAFRRNPKRFAPILTYSNAGYFFSVMVRESGPPS